MASRSLLNQTFSSSYTIVVAPFYSKSNKVCSGKCVLHLRYSLPVFIVWIAAPVLPFVRLSLMVSSGRL